MHQSNRLYEESKESMYNNHEKSESKFAFLRNKVKIMCNVVSAFYIFYICSFLNVMTFLTLENI